MTIANAVTDWFIVAFWCLLGVLWALVRLGAWIIGCLLLLALVFFFLGGCSQRTVREEIIICSFQQEAALKQCKEDLEEAYEEEGPWGTWGTEYDACKAKANRKYDKCIAGIR